MRMVFSRFDPGLLPEKACMSTEDLPALLKRVPAIRHACDLDLLLFFRRHPCALLALEQLVTSLGYDREQVSKSIDAMIEAGLVSRSQNRSRTARLYVLEAETHADGPVSALLEIASTRHGRQDAMRLLRAGPDRAPRDGKRGRATLTQVA